MTIQIGYEIEMATPVSEDQLRHDFAAMGYAVKDGRAANHVGPYHAWGIAIDGSVQPTSNKHSKFELISPVMPLEHGIEVLYNVFRWMENTGGYTNDSCGFHVGVSSTNKTKMKALDGLKLAMLLEEDEILKKFGRTKSHWVRPIKKDMIATLTSYNRNIENLYKDNVVDTIRNAVPKSKSYSANMSRLPNYVEFRIMGGNYSTRFDECADTIRHYSECISAACEPELLKTEYEMKLTNFIETLHRSVEIRKQKELEALERKRLQLIEMIQKDYKRRNQRIRIK